MTLNIENMKILSELKKLIVAVLICFMSSLITAQSENNNSNQEKENRESRKIAFFTAKMNLNIEESRVFWPIVNKMENELKDLRNKNAQSRIILKNKKIEDFSDKELEEMMDAKMQMGKEKVDILIKYHEKFKELLPIQKVAKYYQASKEFKKIQSERKKQQNNPGERKR
tara:strand:- start:1793 stop:2302 length:510 start_codon:yes stop_codon:yes gene_type:complete